MTFEEAVNHRKSLASQTKIYTEIYNTKMIACVTPKDHKDFDAYSNEFLKNPINVNDATAIQYSKNGEFVVMYLGLLNGALIKDLADQ